MNLSTANLVLEVDTPIDLQLHTTNSDGKWTPEGLLDHLTSEGFGLAAITDHERVDTADNYQQLATEKNMPLLVAAELTATWRGDMTDILCFGFDSQKDTLKDLAQDVIRRQAENTREVYENLVKRGYKFSQDGSELADILVRPSSQHLFALVDLIKKHSVGKGESESMGRIILQCGGAYATNEVPLIVEAAHQDGAVCILAHPGRTDGFVTYDVQVLDELRKEAPIDGIEVYYPVHTPAQTDMFLEYATRHQLLISAGSDSHGPDKLPVKYPAKLCRSLLERMGIQIKG